MKKFLLLVVIVVVAVSATIAQVQVVPGKDDQGRVVQPNVVFGLPELAKPNQLLVGEPMTFLFHSSKELVRRGDSVELTLVSMVTSSEIYGFYTFKVCKAGRNGEWSAAVRGGCVDIQPYISYTGWKNGLFVGERIKIYTRAFNDEDLNGKYRVFGDVYNNAGVKLQSVSVEFYLTDTGTVPRDYFIRKVDPAPSGHSLVATGKFRIGAPYFCMVGVMTQGFVIWGNNPTYASYSTDGVTLSIGAMVFYNSPTFLDVIVQTPGDPAINKPGSILAPAYVP